MKSAEMALTDIIIRAPPNSLRETIKAIRAIHSFDFATIIDALIAYNDRNLTILTENDRKVIVCRLSFLEKIEECKCAFIGLSSEGFTRYVIDLLSISIISSAQFDIETLPAFTNASKELFEFVNERGGQHKSLGAVIAKESDGILSFCYAFKRFTESNCELNAHGILDRNLGALSVDFRFESFEKTEFGGDRFAYSKRLTAKLTQSTNAELIAQLTILERQFANFIEESFGEVESVFGAVRLAAPIFPEKRFWDFGFLAKNSLLKEITKCENAF